MATGVAKWRDEGVRDIREGWGQLWLPRVLKERIMVQGPLAMTELK
jgi:hypothetical protein